MTGKRYLKWYNKVGYGSGDIAGNVVYAFLSSYYNVFTVEGTAASRVFFRIVA